MLKNTKLKQMMVDIEKHYSPPLGKMWFVWIDGVCLISGGNFLWVNKHTVSLKNGILEVV